MTLIELVADARRRGLREMRVHLVGTTDPQWQVSSKFAGSSGYHIAIGADLEGVLLEALNPPTGALPPAAPAVGLFD
jgi:hypothetical protein